MFWLVVIVVGVAVVLVLVIGLIALLGPFAKSDPPIRVAEPNIRFPDIAWARPTGRLEAACGGQTASFLRN
jgi:hypothetical protein